MNVGFVTHAYPRRDGDVAGAFIERLALALRDRGHTVTVIAPADEGRGGEEDRHGIPVRRVRYAPARWETLAYRGTLVDAGQSPWRLATAGALVLRQAQAIARACRDRRLDLVHAHWWVPGGMSAWLATLGGRFRPPYVVTLHGTDVALLEGSASGRLVARQVLGGARAVTAVSSYLARQAACATGCALGRIAVQPLPVDTGAFSHFSAGGGGVVSVGRLTRQKRIDLVLEAVAQLRALGQTLPLTVVGDGPERAALERRAAELGLTAQTRFLGAVAPDAIPAVLGDADVFAFPALAEGLGLAAAEALMLGIPVVAATDGGGVTDIVPAAGGGRVVRAGEGTALARALHELVGSAEARRGAAEAGAALRRRLAPAAVAAGFEAVYRRALHA